MRSSIILAVASLFAAGNAVLSAREIVDNIDQITRLSADTNDAAKDISLANAFTKAPRVVKGFQAIITAVGKDVAAMSGLAKVKRQSCTDPANLEGCLQDIENGLHLPGQTFGVKTKRSLRTRQAAPPYTAANQYAICEAARNFVRVHQQLLETVIGKHGVLSLTPFTVPVALALQGIESGVDSIAFGIINVVPVCADDARRDFGALSVTIKKAEIKYSPRTTLLGN